MTILCKCQGGDFVLEEKIKKETVIASKSIVNSKTWQKKFRRKYIIRKQNGVKAVLTLIWVGVTQKWQSL